MELNFSRKKYGSFMIHIHVPYMFIYIYNFWAARTMCPSLRTLDLAGERRHFMRYKTRAIANIASLLIRSSDGENGSQSGNLLLKKFPSPVIFSSPESKAQLGLSDLCCLSL